MTGGVRALAAALLAAVVVLLADGPARAAAPRPELSGAASAIVVDARTGEPILRKHPTERRAIASTTKIMTALLTLEHARPGDVYTAPAYDAGPAESKINLRKGERMRVDDLLQALLLESANDAAATLAQGVAGSTATFVDQMNRKAQRLGLNGTSYANPVGLDDPNNYSTAADLAKLATATLRNRRFAKIVNTPSAQLVSGARPRLVDNRNDLVARFPFVDGVKTGFTRQARNVLVGAARAHNGARVVSVVMGEPSESARDADTLALLRYGLGRFHRRLPLRRGRVAAKARVRYRDQHVFLGPARNVAVTVRRGQRVTRRIRRPKTVEGPLRKGRKVGSVTVLVDGRPVKRVGLVTLAEAPGAGPVRIVASVLGLPLTLLLLLAMVGGAAVGGMRLRAARDRRRREQRRSSRTA